MRFHICDKYALQRIYIFSTRKHIIADGLREITNQKLQLLWNKYYRVEVLKMNAKIFSS